MNVSSDCCIVFLHKGTITEVILVYDLNAREFLPNSVGYFAWVCQILFLHHLRLCVHGDYPLLSWS